MYAVNDITDYEMRHVFNQEEKNKYFRFQPILETQETKMDNTDPDNIKALRKHAQDLILHNPKKIEEIVKTLNIPKDSP